MLERIHTARLSGQRLVENHLLDLVTMDTDSQLMATLGGIRTLEASKAYLADNLLHWQRHGYGLWFFYDRAHTLVGRGGIRRIMLEGKQETEIAYALMPGFWGQGLATEMALSFTGYAEQLGLKELVAFTLTTNGASCKVMQKTGFLFEKEFVHYDHPHVLYRLSL